MQGICEAVSAAFICIDSSSRCDANSKQLQLFAIKCNRIVSFIHSHSLMQLPLHHLGHRIANLWTSEQLKARLSPLSLSHSHFVWMFLKPCVIPALLLPRPFPIQFPARSLDTLCTCHSKMRPELKWQYFCRLSVLPDNYCTFCPALLCFVSPESIYLFAPSLSLSYLLAICHALQVVVGARPRPACLMNWAWARAWSPSSFFMAMRQKQDIRQPASHISSSAESSSPSPSPSPSPSHPSFCPFHVLLRGQCVKMLAPASNRHAAKVSNDTCSIWVCGMETSAWVSVPGWKKGSCYWYSGCDRTFSQYLELLAGFLKAVWQVETTRK